MRVADRLQRRVVPRAVVALSTVRWPGRLAAAVRRALRGRARVRVYVAFDDPSSAIAVLGLVDRLEGRRVRLDVEPVVARGIEGDPAVDDKRRYAVADSRRLARRSGRELTRTQPVAAEDTAFLAAWAAAAPRGPDRTAFCAAALEHLWLASDGPVDRGAYEELWSGRFASAPPADGAGRVRTTERRMRRRGLYDTPIAVVHGEWFFAHERLAAIEHRLDDLGWVASS